MAKIPRLESGGPSGVNSGQPTGAGDAAALQATLGLGKTAYDVAAGAERAEAMRLRSALEKKQAVVNEVEAGRRAGDFEEDLVGYTERLQKDFADAPDKAPEKLLEYGRRRADQAVNEAPNDSVRLEMAQRTNSRLDSAMREVHNWVQARQTQKIKGDLERTKNQIVVKAGRVQNAAELEWYRLEVREQFKRQFDAAYGADSGKQMTELFSRMASSYVRVQGDFNPKGVLADLRDPQGPIAADLNEVERDSLISRTEAAVEHIGRRQQYDSMLNATGKAAEASELLNQGRLGAREMLSLQEANAAELKLARWDFKGTKEQQAEHVKFLEGQAKRLDDIDDIRMRSVKSDPLKLAVADAAAIEDAQKALKKFRRQKEQLPTVIEQMDRLTRERKSGAISAAGYATAFSYIGKAYEKAQEDEQNNVAWIFDDSREAMNRELNRVLEGSVQGATTEDKKLAYIEAHRLFLQAAKAGEVQSKAAQRLARVAISNQMGKNYLQEGD